MIRVDEESDAFFRLGDEGTYAGGPHSMAPLARDNADEDELAVGIATEQLERRDRLKRLVTTLVGALGAAVMILLPFKLGAFGVAPRQEQPVVAKLPPVAPLPAVAAPAAPRSSPAVTPPAPIAALPSEALLPHTANVATPPESTRPAAPVPTRAQRPLRATARVATPARSIVARPSNLSRGPVRALAPGHAPRGVHIPPTASFPD